MEYGSIQFHIWNHLVPCMEIYGMSVCHGSMYGILWNHTGYMVSCMELHGNLLNLDPDKDPHVGSVNVCFR